MPALQGCGLPLSMHAWHLATMTPAAYPDSAQLQRCMLKAAAQQACLACVSIKLLHALSARLWAAAQKHSREREAHAVTSRDFNFNAAAAEEGRQIWHLSAAARRARRCC
jgi:hypothetical protein